MEWICDGRYKFWCHCLKLSTAWNILRRPNIISYLLFKIKREAGTIYAPVSKKGLLRVLSICPPFMHQYAGVSVCQLIDPSVSQSVSQSVRPSVSQSVSQSVSPSVCQSVSQTVSQSVSQSVHPSVSQSVSPSVSQSVRQSVSLSVCQTDSQSVSQSVSQIISLSKRRGKQNCSSWIAQSVQPVYKQDKPVRQAVSQTGS